MVWPAASRMPTPRIVSARSMRAARNWIEEGRNFIARFSCWFMRSVRQMSADGNRTLVVLIYTWRATAPVADFYLLADQQIWQPAPDTVETAYRGLYAGGTIMYGRPQTTP